MKGTIQVFYDAGTKNRNSKSGINLTRDEQLKNFKLGKFLAILCVFIDVILSYYKRFKKSAITFTT